VPHEIVATWPTGTFLENIAAVADGSFVISVHNKRELHSFTAAREGNVWVSLPGPPAGLIAVEDGVFVTVGEPGKEPGRIFKVGNDGRIEQRFVVPDTLFLNGFTPGRNGRAYTVDSIVGAVIEVDLRQSTSRVVLRDERLTKCSAEPMLPGANGMKADDSSLYITNTDRALVLRAPMGPDGLSGELEVVAEHLRGDDLALDLAGNLYITNHIHNTLIRLNPAGDRVAIAGPDEGMAGSTACVFRPGEAGALYVTTTGGMVMPLNGVVQEAKLVRLDVGEPGRPIPFPL
jgi:sugar lactone lactonase YvrE